MYLCFFVSRLAAALASGICARGSAASAASFADADVSAGAGAGTGAGAGVGAGARADIDAGVGVDTGVGVIRVRIGVVIIGVTRAGVSDIVRGTTDGVTSTDGTFVIVTAGVVVVVGVVGVGASAGGVSGWGARVSDVNNASNCAISSANCAGILVCVLVCADGALVCADGDMLA